MKTHSLSIHTLIRKLRLSFLVVFFSIITTTSFSQAYKNNWFFPDNNALDFSSSSPLLVTGSAITGNEGSVSMSDDAGNLLFYSNFMSIWDVNHNSIPLVGGFLNGTDNGSQGVVFKNPANQSQYYFFYVENTTVEEKSINNHLYYSIIDASVSPIQILGWTPGVCTTCVQDIVVTCNNCIGPAFAEAMTAVPHCNGIDYWVIVHGDNEIIVYLVNANGVFEHGVFPSFSNGTNGIMKASPDGTRLALALYSLEIGATGSPLNLYDFNATTGVISNHTPLSMQQHYGVSFSPNSNVLYSSSLLPYALEIYDLTTFNNTTILGNFDGLQLANDGKIYLHTLSSASPTLGVIDTPDNSIAPSFVPNVFAINPITTGGSTGIGFITFIDALQPPIPTDFIANVGACGVVNVDINPCWAGYNVSWNFGDGGTSPSVSTTHTYTTAGTFTITLTVSLGLVTQTFTQEITVNTCCNSSFGYPTIPSTGDNSITYGSSFGILPGTIAINGNFTINNNFTIKNKTLLMAPNTKIIVTSGNTLTIENSILYSCGTQMWDGIEIRPGGFLKIAKNTWVEDAKIAVLSDNNGGIANFTIQNTTFNRNYIGVQVQNYTSASLHLGTIRSSTFDSRVSTTSTVNTSLLDAPYNTQPAEYGVYLLNVSNVQVGLATIPTAKNNFRYLKVGIRGLAANYKVYNNDFRNNVPKCWAIVNTGSNMQVGGYAANEPNNFENLWNGISHTSGSDLFVLKNTFNNITEQIPVSLLSASIAVYTHECNNASIKILNNTLNYTNIGFKHFKNAKTTYSVANNTFGTFTQQAIACIENQKGTIDVFQNQFTGGANPSYIGNTAVYVAGTGITFPTSAIVNINKNVISRINKGIHVVTVGRPIIENNTITFGANISPLISEWYKGIQTQNCAREEIHLNTVNKIGTDPTSAMVNALYGISVESTTLIPFISENTVKKMGSGFRFRSFVGEADFWCNTMNKSWYGLTIDNAKIGNQGEAPSVLFPNGGAADNSWTDPSLIGSPTAVKGLGTIFSPAFYTRGLGGYPFTPDPIHQSPLNVILTGSNSGLGFLNLAPQQCQTICYDPTTCKIPRLAKIARNENPFDQVFGNERFMMQEAVLRGVISDSLVMDTTTQDGKDLQMYIDTLVLTNVGKLVEVTTLFARGDTALAEAKNTSINPKECADAYHKMVNEIYFRTWAKNIFEFSPTDSTVLYDIAVQDPLICGTAIYNARVMMNIDVNDYSVDAKTGNRLMNTNGAAEKQVQQQLPSGKLYPNPSQHTVNYEITLAAEQVGLLVFYDTMGKEVLANQLSIGGNKLTIDVSKFKNGLYLYKVFINGKPQETGKFIIQH